MKISKKYSYYFILGLMFLCTILLRVYKLAQLPDILHIDEAGLGYNAWCLAHYGTDRYLNVHPFLRAKFRRRSKSSIYLHACPSDQNNRLRKCLPMAYQTSGSDCQSASLGCRRKKHLSDFP